MSDDIGAFVPGPRIHIEGRAGGPLSGLTFVAKDLFDVAGVPTGGGNHDWPTGRPIPTKHSWAVQTLLDAGAALIGKTITDEVSLGILGENAFDGTPNNIRAPGRVPGGSSSGSAAAVAAGLCDTALGVVTTGKKGKVIITLDLERSGDSSQVLCKHAIKYARPTAKGKVMEEANTSTPLHVGVGGVLSLFPMAQTQDMFQRETADAETSPGD